MADYKYDSIKEIEEYYKNIKKAISTPIPWCGKCRGHGCPVCKYTGITEIILTVKR